MFVRLALLSRVSSWWRDRARLSGSAFIFRHPASCLWLPRPAVWLPLVAPLAWALLAAGGFVRVVPSSSGRAVAAAPRRSSSGGVCCGLPPLVNTLRRCCGGGGRACRGVPRPALRPRFARPPPARYARRAPALAPRGARPPLTLRAGDMFSDIQKYVG